MKGFFLIFTLFSFCVLGSDFPYQYTPEVLEKNWMKVRVEGQEKSYLQNPFRFVGYSIKAFKKKFTAPVEELKYFDEQKKIFEIVDQYEREHLQALAPISMSLVGDIMWLRTGWSGFLDSRLYKHMDEKDFVFGNLETLISKSHEVPTFPPARATFNSPPSVIDEFKGKDGKNIFSALSVANNHSLDYGELGFIETLKVLQDKGIPFSGVLLDKFESTKKRWVKVQNKGLSVGFYAATYGMNNRWEETSEMDFNLLKDFAPHNEKKKVNLAEIQAVLEEMDKEKIDIKIVSLHWGFEYEYYPEPRQMIIGREIVKLGADIIMGHHSHSQQPMELCFLNGHEKEILKGKTLKGCFLKDGGRPRKALLLYGLGNFLTNMYGFLSEVGTIVDLNFYKDDTGYWDFVTPKLSLIYNERDFGKDDKRTTVFIRDYLKANCFKKKCDKDDLKSLNFLKNLYSPVVYRP